ncbi:MAG TPA: YIP1 family protein [Bdellovibrionales bacterium]|nr:YIP1 family protein [Bdellovibrionales bacterium]
MSTPGAAVWQNTKSRLRDILTYLPLFLRSPVASIQRVPDWDFVNALLLLVLITIPSGILGGIFARNIMTILWGIFLLPFITVFITAILAIGFYYTFMALFRAQVDPAKLFLTIVLASIPFLVLRILVPVIPLFSLIGVVLSAVLLTVGVTDNFNLPKQKVFKLMGGLIAVFFIFWIVQTIQSSRRKTDYSKEIPAETLQQLKEELEKETE